MIQYDLLQHVMLQNSMLQYGMLQHGMLQYGMLEYRDQQESRFPREHNFPNFLPGNGLCFPVSLPAKREIKLFFPFLFPFCGK